MRVLVTGAAGFLGYAVAALLVERGVLARHSPPLANATPPKRSAGRGKTLG